MKGWSYIVLGIALIGLASYALSTFNGMLDDAEQRGRNAEIAKCKQQKIEEIAAAEIEKDRVHKADMAITAMQLGNERARATLLNNQLKVARGKINELHKSNVCNYSLDVMRVFNDLRRQFEGMDTRGQPSAAEAGALTVVTGEDFGDWAIDAARRYYDLADQLVALQKQVEERQ